MHPRADPGSLDAIVQSAFIKASNAGGSDQFGLAVAVDGDTAVVGAPFESGGDPGVNGYEDDDSAPYSGAAYVYVRENGRWRKDAYLKASNAERFDLFGGSVAISGNTIVVGAEGEASCALRVNGNQHGNRCIGAGAAYVFVHRGDEWVQQAYLKATNTDGFDRFGRCVSIDGDTIVVTANGEDSLATGVNGNQNQGLIEPITEAGAAYVFVRAGTSWTQEAYLKASNTERLDFFGQCAKVSGDTIVVSADQEDGGSAGVNGNQLSNSEGDSGACYVFTRRGTTWAQEAYIKASNPGGGSGTLFGGDRFGTAIDIDGDTLVVGAPLEESNATGVNGDDEDDSLDSPGAAYVFVRSGTSWSQEAYLKALQTGSHDLLGVSVGVSGDRIAVGAGGEGGLSVGVNGDPTGESGLQVGAAYLYERAAGAWGQVAYVKPSNPDAVDAFSGALALDRDALVVGSPGEDSETRGVNVGSSNVGLLFNAGAVYVFDLAARCGVARYGTYTGANGADLHSTRLPVADGSFELALSAFDQDGVALVGISNAPASLPLAGGTLWIQLASPAFVSAPVAIGQGAGRYSVRLPLETAGLTYYAQAAMPTGGGGPGLELTNGLRIAVCRPGDPGARPDDARSR